MPKAKTQSRYIPKRVKEVVRERDRNRCRECGDTSYLEFDHITPHSKGAPNTVENIQLLCRRCNLAKGKRTPKCKRCGSWIPADAGFCHSCGGVIRNISKSRVSKSEYSIGRKVLIAIALFMVFYGLASMFLNYIRASF